MASNLISATKVSQLLALVQVNPEIGSDNAAFIEDLVEEAALFLFEECNLSRYPELISGYSQSGASPSTDLTGLSTNKISITVDFASGHEVEPVLANCDSGANTAGELQRVIQAVDEIHMDEVTVVYANSLYTATSGRYGENSSIHFTFSEDTKDVAQAMKLGPEFGGIEVVGGHTNEPLDRATVLLATAMYSLAGVEGIKSGNIGGLSFQAWERMPPDVRRAVTNNRRMWPT